MITIHENVEEKFRDEPNFKIFIHRYICCVLRINPHGHLCGYVAVEKSHPFYGKDYNDEVTVPNADKVPFNGNYLGLLSESLKEKKDPNSLSLNLAINVHGGLTYAHSKLRGIEDGLFGNVWWFGFDTAHAYDLRPFQTDIDRRYPISDSTYRDFEYVENEVKKLAEQLYKFEL